MLATNMSLQAALVQRWSFNAPAGAAPSGTSIPNEISGGSPAVVVGPAATFTNGSVKIVGGGSGTAGYVDLPNNLISPLTSCTLEGWVSVDAGGNAWGRVFDFGDSLGAELTAPGGGGEGKDYLALTASRGADYNVQRLEWRNETPGGPGPGGATTLDSGVATAFGQVFHYAVTVAPDGGGGSLINYYRNGVHISTDRGTAFVLADLNDINNWLGRSNWTADANLSGSFDEFRIYDTALTEAQVGTSRLAGPDAGLPDTDGDGIPNFYELQRPTILNPANPADAALDGDSDGLSNLREFQLQSNPLVNDTDGDGLTDGAEVNTHLTNLLVVDTDGDSLPDGQEITLGTSPTNADTDGDSFSDATEIVQGTDPKSAASVPLLLLVNRYEFNAAAASTSRTVGDSVGEISGVILGEGFSWNSTKLVLAGGSSDTAAYVDLPNGFISRHARANGGSGTITIEGWVTVTDSGPAWPRIFDFGSSQPAGIEITGPGNTNGGGTEGRDYLIFTGYNGNDAATRQLDWRNEDPRRGGGVVGAYATATFGSQFHFVITVDEIARKARAYENGVKTADVTLNWGLADLHDINCWLGRSNWTADGNIAAEYDEFRIYSGLMTEEKIVQNTIAGPTSAPNPDTDGDGMPDWYELRYGLNRNSAADASSDTDGDAVTALNEFRRGSRPNAADSDGDGLGDAAETNTGVLVGPANTGTSPANKDTDGDGATDSAEVTAGSNPFLYDTDADGLSDGVEIVQGTSPTSNAPANAPLAHRWSFNNAQGAANNGATSPDAVGAAPAVIRGSGSSFTGTGVMLSGGSSATGSYVDLKNGILSSRRVVTLEGWYSVNETTGVWGRVFDFGDSAGAEQTAPGGGGEGLDYIGLTAARGGNYDQQRLEWRDESPAGGGAVTFDSDIVTPIGENIHVVVTLDNSNTGSTLINYWRNGELQANQGLFPGNLSELHDVNNWLGRSNWSGDGNLAGTFDEFRVYEGLLNDASVKANFAAGPEFPPGTAPSAEFSIGSVSRNAATGAITLGWSSEPGKTYIIQHSLNLAGWTDLPGTIPSGGTTTTATFTPPPGPIRYFRVKRS